MSRGFVGLEGSEIDFCWVSRGLGRSGFGVKSVFAGCLDGLATFVDWFVNVFLMVVLFGLACGLEGCFCWGSRGFGWFGIWFGVVFLLGVSWFWLVWQLAWGSLFGGCLVVFAGLAYVLEGCFCWVSNLVKTRHSPVRSKRDHAENKS